MHVTRVSGLLFLLVLTLTACAPEEVAAPLPAVNTAETASVESNNQQSGLEASLLVASLTTINNDPNLMALMTTRAEAALEEHCAACHGATLEGGSGVPSLVDYEWIWAISGEEVTTTEPIHKIMQTILYGIRDRDCPDDTKSYGACPDTRYSEMPAYRKLGFTDQQLQDVTEYVLDLSGQTADPAAVERAQGLIGVCTECHGENGYGYKPYGGPDLTDAVWLYGGTREEIFASIAEGRLGVCPPWANKLDAVTIKALGVYLYRRSQGY